MNEGTVSRISLAVSAVSIVISGLVAYDNFKSSRESISIQQLGLGNVSLDSGVNLTQKVLVANNSTRTVSIADSSCSVISVIRDAENSSSSSCTFLREEQMPVTIAPGEAKSFVVDVHFRGSEKMIWTMRQWETRHPEKDAMCFFSYILNVYGRDFAGNKYNADLPDLPEPGTPPHLTEDTDCGSEANTFAVSWGLLRVNSVANLSAYIKNEEDVYFQAFRVELETTRGNRFASDQMFGSFGSPGGF